MNEDRSARYQKLRRLSAVASTAWSAGVLLLLAATPGSIRVREWAEHLAGRLVAPAFEPTAVVLAYVVFLGLAHEAGALPVAFYREFLLEHRYGLSTESVRGWVVDWLKGGLVGAAISLAGASTLYLVIRHWPAAWWAIAGAGFTLAAVALTGLAPVALMPMFFTLRPLGRQELRDRLIALSRRAGVAVVDACEWQVSGRTKKANAALAGLGRTRRILVSDTLLASHTDDEIEVILAHELGHHVHQDLWRSMLLQAGVAMGGMYLAARVLSMAASRLGWEGPGDVAGLPVLLLVAGLLSLSLLPVANALSRRMERAADRFAFELTGRADVFAAAIGRLGVQNLAEERPSRISRWLFHTHPPVGERVAAARAWERRPSGH